LATTNTEVHKAIKSILELLKRVEKEGLPGRRGIGFSSSGSTTVVEIDLSATDGLLSDIKALLATIDADTSRIPAGPSLAAKQDTANDFLALIETDTDALDGALMDIEDAIDDNTTAVLAQIVASTTVNIAGMATQTVAQAITSALEVISLNNKQGDTEDAVDENKAEVILARQAISANGLKIDTTNTRLLALITLLDDSNWISLGEAVTAGHLVMLDQGSPAHTTAVVNTHVLRVTIDAGSPNFRHDVHLTPGSSDVVIRILEMSQDVPDSTVSNPTSDVILQADTGGVRLRKILSTPEGTKETWPENVGDNAARPVTVVDGTFLRWFESLGLAFDAGDTIELYGVVRVLK